MNPGTLSANFDPDGASFGITNMGTPSDDWTPFTLMGVDEGGDGEMFRDYFYDPVTVQKATECEVNGQRAASLVVRGENLEGTSITFTVVTILAEEGSALAMIHYPTARESEFKPILDEMLNSVVISERQMPRPPRELLERPDPKRERPADAPPPPVLTLQATPSLAQDDFRDLTWTCQLTNPGTEAVSVTCKAFEVQTWEGGAYGGTGSTRGSRPMEEPIELEPGARHKLGSASRLPDLKDMPKGVRGMARSAAKSFGKTQIMEYRPFALSGQREVGTKGVLYLEDAEGYPFQISFEESATVHIVPPGTEAKEAACPRIASITFGFDRPPRLRPEQVREVNTYLDLEIENPNPCPVRVTSVQFPVFREQIGWARPAGPSAEQDEGRIQRMEVWVDKRDNMMKLLNNEVTEVPIKGRVTLLIEELGWRPSLFELDVRAVITLDGDTGVTSEVTQSQVEQSKHSR